MVKRLLVRAVSWPGLLILATASVYVWQAWDPGGWYLPTAKTALVLLQWVHEWTVAFAQQFLPEYMSNFIKNNPPDMHRAHGYLIVFLMFVFAAILGMVLWVLGKAFSFLTGGLPRTSPQSQPTQPSPPQNQGPSKRRGMKVFLWVGALLLGVWAFTGGAVASVYGATAQHTTTVMTTIGRFVMGTITFSWKVIAISAAVFFAFTTYFGLGPVGKAFNDNLAHYIACDDACQARRDRARDREEELERVKHERALARARGADSGSGAGRPSGLFLGGGTLAAPPLSAPNNENNVNWGEGSAAPALKSFRMSDGRTCTIGPAPAPGYRLDKGACQWRR